MITPDTGCLKKVQFCIAAALMAWGLQAAGAELSLPIEEVQQQLTRKLEDSFSRKLEACGDGEGQEKTEKESGPRYPVWIAAEETPALWADTLLAAPRAQ